MSEGLDFFISYTLADRRWAEWIAWQLEAEGYTTRIQAWDFRPGDDFVEKMHEAVKQAKRIMPVLSPAYFKSVFATKEWVATYAKNPAALVPVRVVDCELEGLFTSIVHIDLVDKDGKQARADLVAGVDQARAKPSVEPLFPGKGEARVEVAKAASPRFPGDLPRIWTLTLQRNRFFKGRDLELKQIREALKAREGGVSDTVVLHGLGGIGKTQLAMEYAWCARDQYDHVFWIEGDTPASLHANLAALVVEGVLSLAEKDAKDESVRLRAVRRWLANNTGWLLLVDNLDTQVAAEAALGIVKELRRGHVLMTSRRADWPQEVVTVRIGVLPRAAAREFLTERSQTVTKKGPTKNERANIARVAKKLGCLPLALEQAAAYVAKHRIDYGTYLVRLASAPKSLLGYAAGGAAHRGRDRRSVLTTWSITEGELGSAARAILRLCAFFAPDDIPRQLFSNASEVFAEALALMDAQGVGSTPVAYAEPTENGLIELADYSLITLGPTGFSCHGLQLDVQRERLADAHQHVWIALALRLVLAAMPQAAPDDVRSWPFWIAVRPHMSALIGAAVTASTTEFIAEAMSGLGRFLASKAEWREAERLFRSALAIDVQRFGAENPVVAPRLSNLAYLLLATNRLEEAERLVRRALAINEDTHGANHPAVAICLDCLAQILRATSRSEEAEPLMRRALKIEEANYGIDDPRLAVHLSNLAGVLNERELFVEAEELVRRAMAIDERSYGVDHPEVGSHLNNLGLLLKAAKRLDEAERLMRRALEIAERSFGMDHPTVATYLNNLAGVQIATKRFDKAEPLMRRALEIDERSYGTEHPKVAMRLNDLAQLLLNTDRLREAEPLMRQAVGICLAIRGRVGHAHPTHSTTQLNYERLLTTLGWPPEQIHSHLATLEAEATARVEPLPS